MYVVECGYDVLKIVSTRVVESIGGPQYGYWIFAKLENGVEEQVEGYSNLPYKEAVRLAESLKGKCGWGWKND